MSAASAAMNESNGSEELLYQYVRDLPGTHFKYNIHQLYLQIFGIPQATRTVVGSATSGCRFWQLIFAIIWQSIKENNGLLSIFHKVHQVSQNKSYTSLYRSLLDKCRRVLSIIRGNTGSNLYRIIYGNQVIQCSGHNSACITPYDHDMITTTAGVYYLCIYITRQGRNIISHYFTVVHVKGELHLLSSYGCDNVCASYSVLPLHPDEIEEFNTALSNVPSNMGIIGSFYKKFFFNNSRPIYCSEDQIEGDSSLKGKLVVDGPNREVQEIFDQPDATYHMGIIRGYEAEVESIAASFGGTRRIRSIHSIRRIRSTRRTRRNKKRSTRRRV